jgi:molybdenum-dependent DNA-binding transcriptional regulator ModE
MTPREFVDRWHVQEQGVPPDAQRMLDELNEVISETIVLGRRSGKTLTAKLTSKVEKLSAEVEELKQALWHLRQKAKVTK